VLEGSGREEARESAADDDNPARGDVVLHGWRDLSQGVR
jgi:hypothetical protein